MVYEDAAIAAMYLVKTNYIFKVVEFHPDRQTVDVIQDVVEFANAPDGEFIVNNEFGIDVRAGVLEPDYLTEVPVMQLRWGQFEVQCCPKKDDTGVLAVFTNDIRNWVNEGGTSIPRTDNHFMKSSCVFIPFIPNAVNCAQDYPTDNNSLVIKSANAKITLTDDGTTSDVKIESDTMTIGAQNGVSITGDVTIDGKLDTTGTISSDDDITSSGTVTASTDVKIGTLGLGTHIHTAPSSGGPTTGPTSPTPAP